MVLKPFGCTKQNVNITVFLGSTGILKNLQKLFYVVSTLRDKARSSKNAPIFCEKY